MRYLLPFGTVDITQVGTGVHIVVDPGEWPNRIPLDGRRRGAGLSFALFPAFNATGVVLGDIHPSLQTFAGQTLAAVGGSLRQWRPRGFRFRDRLRHLRNGNSRITSNLDFTIANATDC